MEKFFYVLLDTRGRPGPGGNSQGDPPYYAYPRGRPVTDNVAMVGAILFRDAGFVKKDGVGLYILTERFGETM